MCAYSDISTTIPKCFAAAIIPPCESMSVDPGAKHEIKKPQFFFLQKAQSSAV